MPLRLWINLVNLKDQRVHLYQKTFKNNLKVMLAVSASN